MAKPRTYSCLECGESFIAHQPDDFHIQASLKKEGLRDPVEMKFPCRNCQNVTILNWGKRPKARLISVG